MLTNIFKDPLGLIYENLFFFLTLGKYDTIIKTTSENRHSEEFLIVKEEWKDHINYFENILPMISKYLSQKRKMTEINKIEQNNQFKIFLIIYTTPTMNNLIGLGLHIITSNSNALASFAITPEDRLQKAMYLISRGILKSMYHQIEQVYFQIPL